MLYHVFCEDISYCFFFYDLQSTTPVVINWCATSREKCMIFVNLLIKNIENSTLFITLVLSVPQKRVMYNSVSLIKNLENH